MVGFTIKGWSLGFRDRINKNIVLPVLKKMSNIISKRINNILEGYGAAEWKEKSVTDFKYWLADLPDDLPAGKSATLDSCDLFTILSEFSSLRQEIRIQSREQQRAIKSLNQFIDSYHQTTELFRVQSEGIAQLEERIRLVSEKDSEKNQTKLALPFLDMRDALIRGLRASQNLSSSKSFLRPVPKGINGTIEGYEMAIRRFDRALSTVGIKAIKAVGKKFNPKYMKAIETKSVSGQEKGIVLEELVSGFICNDEIVRTAEVVVSE